MTSTTLDLQTVADIVDRLRGGPLGSEIAYALSNKLAVAVGLQEAPVVEQIVPSAAAPQFVDGRELANLQNQVASLTKVLQAMQAEKLQQSAPSPLGSTVYTPPSTS